MAGSVWVVEYLSARYCVITLDSGAGYSLFFWKMGATGGGFIAIVVVGFAGLASARGGVAGELLRLAPSTGSGTVRSIAIAVGNNR